MQNRGIVRLCAIFTLMWSRTSGFAPRPSDWEFHGGIAYYVHSPPLVWADAKELCLAIGGNLLMPKSADQNTFANSLLVKLGATAAWLNCHRADAGEWQCWVDGVARWPSYNNPAPDQPQLDGNCVTATAVDGMWRHKFCDEKATAVCEKGEKNVGQCRIIGPDGRIEMDRAL